MNIKEMRSKAEKLVQLVKDHEMDFERFKEHVQERAKNEKDEVFFTSGKMPKELKEILYLCEELAKSIRTDYPHETL